MPRQSKARIAEQRYINRVRGLKSGRKVGTTGGKTSWKDFFDKGEGAEVRTDIAKQSISTIVCVYGKRMGKRFVCSYDVKDDHTVVKIEEVQERDD